VGTERELHSPDLLTYAEAARVLHLSRAYVTQLASQRILHPVKLPGRREKFFRQEEISWYQQRRLGNHALNPLVIDVQIPFDTESPHEEKGMLLGEKGILLLLAILIDMVANAAPNAAQLHLFKSDPRFASLRRAILKLSGELVA
jgi:hypothetical protein